MSLPPFKNDAACLYDTHAFTGLNAESKPTLLEAGYSLWSRYPYIVVNGCNTQSLCSYSDRNIPYSLINKECKFYRYLLLCSINYVLVIYILSIKPYFY